MGTVNFKTQKIITNDDRMIVKHTQQNGEIKNRDVQTTINDTKLTRMKETKNEKNKYTNIIRAVNDNTMLIMGERDLANRKLNVKGQ